MLKSKNKKRYKLNKALLKNKEKVMLELRKYAIRKIANFNKNWDCMYYYVWEADSYTLAYRIARMQALKMRVLQRKYERVNK